VKWASGEKLFFGKGNLKFRKVQTYPLSFLFLTSSDDAFYLELQPLPKHYKHTLAKKVDIMMIVVDLRFRLIPTRLAISVNSDCGSDFGSLRLWLVPIAIFS
jgi:hypothetical protein